MKKLILGFFLAILSVFVLGSIAMAADNGVTFNLDYAMMDVADIFDSNMIMLQLDYADVGVFGLSYATAISYDPDISGLNNDLLMLYGGYDFLKDENTMFALIGGYVDWSLDDSVDELSINSLGIGFRTGATFDSGSVYLTYLYGLDNSLDINGVDTGSDFDAYMLELKAAYFFNDSVGMDFAYRSYDAEDFDVSGFGIGVIFKF